MKCDAYHNQQGKFQGLRFYDGEEKFKASEIDRSFSKQQLDVFFSHDNVLERDLKGFAKNVDKEKSVHGIGYTLNLIASLSNQSGSEDMGCGDDDE